MRMMSKYDKASISWESQKLWEQETCPNKAWRVEQIYKILTDRREVVKIDDCNPSPSTVTFASDSIQYTPQPDFLPAETYSQPALRKFEEISILKGKYLTAKEVIRKQKGRYSHR